MPSASRILESGWVGWGLVARSWSVPLRSVDVRVVARRGRGEMLVGAEDDGAEFVELLDFGGGECAIVDAALSILRRASGGVPQAG
jgi:hypothetical protein